MALDIEVQSPTQQDHPRDPDPVKPTSRSWRCLQFSSSRIIFKAVKCLTYTLAAIFVAFLAIGHIAITAQSPAINPDSIAKGIVVFLVSLPFLAMINCILPESLFVGTNISRSSEASIMVGVYNQSSRRQPLFQRAVKTCVHLLGRAGLLLLVWLALTVKVPRLKRLTLLGSPVWRWSLLAVTITAGFFQALAVYMIPFYTVLVTGWIFERRKGIINPHEYYFLGLWPSTTLVMYFGVVLVSWVFYFRTESGLKHPSIPHPGSLEYVTWTWVALFVGSILLFFKNLLLLMWSANAIYRKFQPRILITGFKYLCLGLIIGDFFAEEVIRDLELVEEYDRHGTKFNFTNYIVSKDLDTSYLQRVGQRLMPLATLVRPLKEDGVPDVADFLKMKIINPNDHKCQPDDLLGLFGHCPDLSDKNLTRLERFRRLVYGYASLFAVEVENTPPSNLGNPSNYIPRKPEQFSPEEYRKNIANVFHCIVREQSASVDNSITFEDLKKWMVDVHMNCVNMGRTLVDASAIVTRLDIFISFVIFIAVVLLWLLITGIATTTVLVTIATPLLALTFIFGDSAKTFVQGIIFCFGTHAFDVGDRCILDETELEVKSIGILTTTFVKIGTMEKRMYPNSVLATKPIVNLGWQPDPSDVVELTLDLSTTPKDLKDLCEKIQKFFNFPRKEFGSFDKNLHEVVVKDIGDRINVTLHFRHVLNIEEMTHKQCLEKKNRQRSIFLKTINHFLHGGGWEESEDLTQVLPRPIRISPLRRVRSWS